jgi:hypothetical protein
MAQRLKRWESPRRQGRNDKGRGGSARQRQKQKQLKLLRLKLQEAHDEHSKQNQINQNDGGKGFSSLPSLALMPVQAASSTCCC